MGCLSDLAGVLEDNWNSSVARPSSEMVETKVWLFFKNVWEEGVKKVKDIFVK